MAYTVGTFTWGPGNTPVAPPPIPNVSVATTNVTNVTNVYNVTPVTPKTDTDVQQNILYGHPIAICDLGLAKLGGDIISGPWLGSGMVNGIWSFGLPTDHTGTRKIYKIFADSMLIWESVAGWDGTGAQNGTFYVEDGVLIRFYGGSFTQAADNLENFYFPGEAVAYRPQMLLAIELLPYARFVKPVPYIAALIGDTTGGADPADGVNIAKGHERIAHTHWVGYTASTFEADIGSDVAQAILIKDNFTMPELCSVTSRGYRNLDLIQSDKLYYRDLGASITPLFTFDADSIIGSEDPISIERSPPSDQPRELECSTIDPDQDYTVVSSLATQARDPVPVSAASGRDSFFLPVVINADARQAVVTYAMFYEENARKRIRFTVTAKGYEIEPGDIFSTESLADGIEDEAFKVIETSHSPNYTVEVIGEALMRCAVSLSDPYFNNVIFLDHWDLPNGTTSHNEESSYHRAVFAADTAQANGGALALDGASTESAPSSSDFVLSSANSDQFTIEATLYHNAIHDIASRGIMGYWGSIGSRCWGLDVKYEGLAGPFAITNGELTFGFSTDGTTITEVHTSGAAINPLVEYKIAVDKDPTGKIRIYVDGVMRGSSTPADSSFFDPGSAALFKLGIGNAGAGFMNGTIDRCRITAGVARYASDGGYSPSSGDFPGV